MSSEATSVPTREKRRLRLGWNNLSYTSRVTLAFAAIAAMIALWFTHATAGMLVLVGLIGFACSSIFSVIYSAALKSHPDKANEISGLMITGVCGGAVIPPLMGASADFAGSQIGSLVVIGCCMAYLAVCALLLRRLETGK